MSLSQIFNIAGSGLNAQSMRLNTTASNIANAETASASAENVYRGRHPYFSTLVMGQKKSLSYSNTTQAAAGVRIDGIVESQAPIKKRFEPHHPKADEDGYVHYPNVNVVEEMANMISASRSFQVNIEVMNSARQMIQQVLSIGQ